MAQTVKWLPKPEKHDFQAAEDYLSLVMPAKRAAEYRKIAQDACRLRACRSLA
jgi:hypothetical protein